MAGRYGFFWLSISRVSARARARRFAPTIVLVSLEPAALSFAPRPRGSAHEVAAP
ncbi:MAG: hypothetical protein GX886_06030 [Comamonadaceae bacterium]|nr:hypothetical protein [Comamonadaceae bacterium]